MTLLAPVAWVALGMTVPLSGTVEDARGRPVAGATVWLGDTAATRKGPEVLASTETDARGHFRLERADDLAGRGAIWSPTLWAFKPGARIGFVEFKGNLPAADEPVRLTLGAPASTPLRVVRPDGSPAAGARVRVVMTTIKAPTPPDGMLDRLAVTTGADGRATIDGLAPDDIFALDVTAPGQIVQCLPIDDDAGTVTLRALGRLKVKVVADDPKAARGWSIKAWSRPTEPGRKGPYTTHWVSEDTNADGRAELPPIAVGQVLWEIAPPAGSNYLVASEPATTIRAGETAEVEIAVRKAVRIEGVVRGEPGGAPIPGVKVDLFPLRFSGSRPVTWLVTDAQGRFSGLVNPGPIRFSFSLHEMPRDYFLPPRTQSWVDFEVKEGEERHEFTPPRLSKGVLVRGKVVDDQGKGAAVVDVTGLWTSADFGANPNPVRAQTDARGEFVLGNIAPRSEVRVSASLGLVADSETVTVPSAGEGGPVTIRLKRRPTLAVSGRVLGPDGKPLAGASVRVKIRAPDQGYNSGQEFTFDGDKEVRTGPDGRFVTPAQLPVGNHYRVEARATGFDPAESPWIVPPDLSAPDLALRRSVATREVAGQVVDSAGKPVAGAEVFLSGDGPSRNRGVAGADGRFRVPGVPRTPALLFVSARGYHFIGRRVEPGERSVDFALRRLDEPPAAPLRPAAPAVMREEERAIARVLIAQARSAPDTVHEVWEKRELPAIAALVDPDRGVAMIENQVVTADPGLLASIAIGRFEREPGGAIELLDAIDSPNMTAHTALNVFDRLGTFASPAIRRALLERAAKSAEKIEEPSEAARLIARVADRWLDLGDRDTGSALVLQARAVAKKPPPEQPGQKRVSFGDDGFRDELALALARIDLAEALKCLEERQAQQFQLETVRAGIAQRIAATDPAGARRLLAQIDDSNRFRARRGICVAMAATDLPTARAVAAEGNDPMLVAVLPAAAARSKAGSNPEAARTLVRESVEQLLQVGEPPSGWGSPSVTLARLLPLIARLDPDRAPDVFWRALALRTPLPSESDQAPVPPQARQQYLDLANLAALAGRYDHAAAEVVFAPVAARLPRLDDDHWGLGTEGPAIFRAAAAFDARAAKALLDALPEDPTPPPPSNVIRASDHRHHSKAQARIALAGSLGLPPAIRLRASVPVHADSNDWLDALDD
jgi:hypothetical protein